MPSPNIGRAIAPIIEEDGCVITGWALQVSGVITEVPDDLEIENLVVSDGAAFANGASFGSTINVGGGGTFYGDISSFHPGGGFSIQTARSFLGATPNEIVSDSGDDVSLFIRLDVLVTNGTANNFASFSLQHGGTTTNDQIVGSETFQTRLNADGSVDIRRTAGALDGTAVIHAMWI